MTQEEVNQMAATDLSEDGAQSAGDNSSAPAASSLAQVDVEALVASLLGWREALSQVLEDLSAERFERLFLRILQEDGIHEIERTAHNDSIEGIGKVGGGGFFSFRVSFKCIRGGARISSGEVEDFRRSVMVGRADRGLLITTGSFTQEAQLKAGSDRAPEIKLIDGEQLLDKLKELKLGVRTEQVVVERVVIDEAWFGGV